MLIIIDSSICSIKKEHEYKMKITLENINQCISIGRHIVIANRETCDYISKNKNLNERTRRTFRNLKLRMTEIANIKEEVNGYILVTNEVSSLVREDNNGRYIFKVPIDYFNDDERLMPTNLVGEDLKDCKFYKVMVNNYIKNKNVKYKLRFNNVSGGGGNTDVNYEDSLIEKKAPCLAIVDSDKEHPLDQYGKTAFHTYKKYESLKENYITECYILNVREKENMIPVSIYRDINEDDSLDEGLSILDRICKNRKLNEIYRYGDIKSGVRISHLTNIEPNKNAVKEYLNEEISKLISENEVDIELLKYIGKKLNYVCKSPKFEQIVNDIESNNINDNNNIEDILNEVFSNIDEQKADSTCFIKGIKKLMKKFDNLEDTLKEKEDLYEKQKTDSLELEVNKLKCQLDKVNNFYNSMPDFLKEEWESLVKTCITWGCSIKIKTN